MDEEGKFKSVCPHHIIGVIYNSIIRKIWTPDISVVQFPELYRTSSCPFTWGVPLTSRVPDLCGSEILPLTVLTNLIDYPVIDLTN